MLNSIKSSVKSAWKQVGPGIVAGCEVGGMVVTAIAVIAVGYAGLEKVGLITPIPLEEGE